MNTTIASMPKKLCISAALTQPFFAPDPVNANRLVHKFEAWGLMDLVRKTFFIKAGLMASSLRRHLVWMTKRFVRGQTSKIA